MRISPDRCLAVAIAWVSAGVLFAVEVPDPRARTEPGPKEGQRVETVEEWYGVRRGELHRFLEQRMYGVAPEVSAGMVVEEFDRDARALGGKATRIQKAIYPEGKAGPRMDLLMYLPNGKDGPVPVVLGLNFWGNHAIHVDPGIRLSPAWVESGPNPYVDLSGVVGQRATDRARGIEARMWPVEEILERGYGVATMYREEVVPDHPPYVGAMTELSAVKQIRVAKPGAIALWAWSLSRAMDVFEKEPGVDGSKVAVYGFSRLGKAALWAAASDSRFAMILSQESGAGGAKLFRRGLGEDIARLSSVFPHWFTERFSHYAGKDRELPFDQHWVMALVAPRPMHVASAKEDRGADAEGEFASLQAVDPIYRWLCGEGLDVQEWPGLGQVAKGRLGYHVREGGHDVLPFDWECHLDFMDLHFRGRKE